MCRYESDFYQIRVHAPILGHKDSFSIKRGFGENRSITDVSVGVDVHEISEDYEASPIGGNGLAWILHRAYRSELEYAYRLFRPRATTNCDYFKDNRDGFLLVEPDLESSEYIRQILPDSAVQEYHDSLDSFLERLSLKEMITTARSCITEEAVLAKLRSIPSDFINRESSLIVRLFQGTRFADWIQCILLNR